MLNTSGSFWILKGSTNLKEIGDVPQVIDLHKTYDTDKVNSIENFANFKGRIPDFVPDLKNCLILHPKSKLTDVVTCSLGPGNDIIISEKLRSILDKFKAGPLQYYDCELIQKNKTIGGYYWVHFIYDLVKEVDFKKSEFHIGPDDVKGINDYNAYLKYTKEKDRFGFLNARKVTLPILADKLDFFMIGRFDQNIYVSEKLHERLLSEGITGVEFNTN